jgi:hypothetical protein
MKQRKKSFGMRISAFVLSFAMVCTLLAGVNVVAFAADGATETVAVSKFYNDADKGGDGEHLFTKDQDEMSWLSSLPTWNNEGVAWKAPVSSSTSVYRCYNPNSGEHLYVDEGYADYLAGMGWNKEKLAFYSDDNEGVPVYRLWNGQDGVGSHHFTTDEGEVAWLVSLGWTAEDVAFFGVKEDQKDKVQLVDMDGLQVDGTAKKGDTLALVFGADFGTPKSVTWYKNGAVVLVATENFGPANLTLWTGNELLGVGNYTVTIENTKGESFTTNTITVVEEGVAIMTDVALSDYTDEYSDKPGSDSYQDYAPTDTQAVLTATLNKQYDGEFEVFKAKDTKFEDAVQAWDTDDLFSSATGSAVKVDSASKLTDKKALDAFHSGYAGIYYVADNGTVTVKLVTTAGLKRGDSYVLTFKQDSDLSDEKTCVSDSFTAPYLPAPVGIVCAGTTNALGLATTTSVAVIGETGLPLTYLGNNDTNKDIHAPNPTQLGLTITAYTNTSNKTTGGTQMALAPTNLGSNEGIVAGVSGMYASALTGIDPAVVGCYATLKTTAGIYGEKAVTLTSDFVALPAEAAETVELSYDVAEPFDITAEFTGLKTSGTLLIVRTDGAMDTTIGEYQTYKDAASNTVAVLQSDMSNVVGMATVTKGQSEVTVEDCVDGIHADKDMNNEFDIYTAVLIPNDTESFGPKLANVDITTIPYPTIGDGVTVYSVPCMWTTTGKTNFKSVTGATIAADCDTDAIINTLDQFGDKMEDSYPIDPIINAETEPVTSNKFVGLELKKATAGSDVGGKFAVDKDGCIFFVQTGGTAQVGDELKFLLGDDQVLTFECKTAGVAGVSKWTVSITED